MLPVALAGWRQTPSSHSHRAQNTGFKAVGPTPPWGLRAAVWGYCATVPCHWNG